MNVSPCSITFLTQTVFFLVYSLDPVNCAFRLLRLCSGS